MEKTPKPIKTVTDPAKLISGLRRLVGDAYKIKPSERDEIYRKHIEEKYGKRAILRCSK